jgi:LPS sulfotransferase NodH
MINTSDLKNIPIFFIIGKGRSGTTLLQTILDANPHVCIPHESHFFIHLYKKYHQKKKWLKQDLLDFYNDLFTEEKIELIWDIDKERLKEDILKCDSNIEFSELCKIIYTHYQSPFPKSDIQIIGDKNPINTMFIDWILSVYPHAKFIHVLRDPRANAASHIKTHPNRRVEFAALKFSDFNKKCDILKKDKNLKILTIKYEDLVSDPKQVLSTICSFLNIELHESMLNHNNVINDNIKEKLIQNYTQKNNSLKLKLFEIFHKNLSRPINTGSLEKWKEELTKDQIIGIENMSKNDMKEYNYPLMYDNHKINFYKKILEKLNYLKWQWQMLLYFNLPLNIRLKLSNRKKKNYLESKFINSK